MSYAIRILYKQFFFFRMKVSIIFLFIALVTLTRADELSGCKCWTGYRAMKSDDGVRCFGILLLHSMDCNEPERPDCKCSGDVNGILSDATGTWCSQNQKDGENKKWACENKEEWEKFFKQYPNEKP